MQFADCDVMDESQLKMGCHRHFEALSDEPDRLGGMPRYYCRQAA
ncbi:hypothetical protein ACFLQ0_06665 [Nitrospinota bacterium]